MAGTLTLDPPKSTPKISPEQQMAVPAVAGAAGLMDPQIMRALTLHSAANPETFKKMIHSLFNYGGTGGREGTASRIKLAFPGLDLRKLMEGGSPLPAETRTISPQHQKAIENLISGMPITGRAQLKMTKDPDKIRKLIEKHIGPQLHRKAQIMGEGDPVVGRTMLEQSLKGSRSGTDLPFNEALTHGVGDAARSGRAQGLKRLGMGAGAGLLGYMLLKRIMGRKPDYQKLVQQQQPQFSFTMPQQKAAALMEKWADVGSGWDGSMDFLTGGGFDAGRQLATDVGIQAGKVINPIAHGAANMARGLGGLAVGGAETSLGRLLPLLGATAPATFAYHGLKRPTTPVSMPELTRADESGSQVPTQIGSAKELAKVLSSDKMRESLSALAPEEIQRGTRARLGGPGRFGIQRIKDYLTGRRLVGGGSVGKFISQLGKNIEGPGSATHKLLRMLPDSNKETLHKDVANLLTRAGKGTSGDVEQALGQSGELSGVPVGAPGLARKYGPMAAAGGLGALLLSRLARR